MPNRETKVLTEYSIAPLADLNAKSARLFSTGFSSDPKKYLSRVFHFDFSRRCVAQRPASFEPAPLRSRPGRAGCRRNNPGPRCPQTSSELETRCSPPVLLIAVRMTVAPIPVVPLCGAACGTHDTSSAVPPGDAGRRGLLLNG